MNCASCESANNDFGYITRKSSQIFNEIIKAASEHDLPENEIFVLKRDILFTLLIVIMTENGFQLKAYEDAVLEDMLIDQKWLSKWKQLSGLYEIEFAMLGFKDISAKLIMVPLRPAVLVNIIINDTDSETYSLCLLVDHYVVLSKNQTSNEKLFRNLQQLSDTFKNKLLTPVKSKLLCFCGYPGASLLGLPEDLFLKIMFYLSIADILSVIRTCRKFNEVLGSDNFWHKICIRDFNPTITKTKNWRVAYQMHYEQ